MLLVMRVALSVYLIYDCGINRQNQEIQTFSMGEAPVRWVCSLDDGMSIIAVTESGFGVYDSNGKAVYTEKLELGTKLIHAHLEANLLHLGELNSRR